MKILENRLKEVEGQITAEDRVLSSFNTAEELLKSLQAKQAKLKDDLPFEIRREIVRTLVKGNCY